MRAKTNDLVAPSKTLLTPKQQQGAGAALKKNAVALSLDAALGYDDFNRLSSLTVTSGTQQNFSYVYDRYGNCWQQNVTAGTGPLPGAPFKRFCLSGADYFA